jgi:hypothetical protein
MRTIAYLALCVLAVKPLQAKEKPSPWKDNYNVERSPTIPKKVRKFVIDAQACVHFSGEINGDNSERDRQVRKTIEKTCKDIDTRHYKLLTKYRGNAEVEAIIAEVWEPFS